MTTPRSSLALTACLALTTSAFPPAQSPATPKTIEWKRITLPFDATAQLLLESVWLYNAATKSTFVGANTKGLFESKDGGDSWARIDDGSFVTSAVNTDVYTLQSGPNGVLYSIDIGSGVYKSETGGRHWTKAFPLGGFRGRIWIDPERPADIYSVAEKATESEPAQTYVEFKHSTNAGTSFDKVDLQPLGTGSVDVSGRLVCYATDAAIRCSENATTWPSLSLTSIATSLAIDWNLNSPVGLTINRTNRELVIVSGGTVYETRNERTVIAPKADSAQTLGRTIDLVFDPARTFPAYGISGLPNGPWMLTKIAASGETESYVGPEPTGFRLKSVDFGHDTFFVWTGEGIYRGTLK